MAKNNGKLNRILSRSFKKTKYLSTKKLKDEYNYLKRIIRERYKTFKNAGYGKKFPKEYRDLPSIKIMNRNEMIESISRLSAYLRGSDSSFTGWKKNQLKDMKRFQDLMGYEFKNEKEYWKFRNFLNDMSERYGELWKYVSDIIVEISGNIAELGVDYEKVLENMDVYMEKQKNGKAMWQTLRKGEEIKGFEDGTETFSVSKEFLKVIGMPTLRQWNKALQGK